MATTRIPPPRVHVTMRPAEYDALYRVARAAGVSIPEVIRRGLRRELADGTAQDRTDPRRPTRR